MNAGSAAREEMSSLTQRTGIVLEANVHLRFNLNAFQNLES